MRSFRRPLIHFALAAGNLLAGPGARGAPAADSSDLEVRLMTFNIRYGTADDRENRWEKRRDLVFGVIREHRPDAVGIQEAQRFQIDELRKALPAYGRIGLGAEVGEKEKDGEHAPILYRTDRFRVDEEGTFWFSDTPEVAGSRGWGNRLPRICTWARLVEKRSGKAFYLFNLHIDHRSQPSRERSVGLLAKKVLGRSHPDPVVVTGDFNAGEDNPAVLYLLGKKALPGTGGKGPEPPSFVDTFRVLHPGAADAGTFHGFKGRRTGEKIDFIFASPGVKVHQAEILHDQKDGRFPSDHFPVIARLGFPARREL